MSSSTSWRVISSNFPVDRNSGLALRYLCKPSSISVHNLFPLLSFNCCLFFLHRINHHHRHHRHCRPRHQICYHHKSAYQQSFKDIIWCKKSESIYLMKFCNSSMHRLLFGPRFRYIYIDTFFTFGCHEILFSLFPSRLTKCSLWQAVSLVNFGHRNQSTHSFRKSICGVACTLARAHTYTYTHSCWKNK